jgi:hypothetical protein
MEFGRVIPKELDTIDFALPKEPLFNKNVLYAKKVIKPKMYVGCAKSGRKEERYGDKNNLDELLKEFSLENKGLIITDTAGRRDMAHVHLTVPKTFIKFVGNSLHKSDFTKLDDWADRIRYRPDTGLVELYFFIHMHDETQSPEIAVDIIEQLNKKWQLNLLYPKWGKDDNNLFN